MFADQPALYAFEVRDQGIVSPFKSRRSNQLGLACSFKGYCWRQLSWCLARSPLQFSGTSEIRSCPIHAKCNRVFSNCNNPRFSSQNIMFPMLRNRCSWLSIKAFYDPLDCQMLPSIICPCSSPRIFDAKRKRPWPSPVRNVEALALGSSILEPNGSQWIFIVYHHLWWGVFRCF